MALISKNKSKLVLDIINEHFGSITKDVAGLLINSENTTLAHILRYFKDEVKESDRIKSSQIRHSLLVLQQHNCLTAQLPPELDPELESVLSNEEKLKRGGILYGINSDMVLNRIRFPKLLLVVKRHFREIGTIIMEYLILHGRSRINQIKSEITIKLLGLIEVSDANIISLLTAEEIMIPKLIEDKIQRIFESMVQRRLIVTVPVLDLQKKQQHNLVINNKKSTAKGTGNSTSFAGNTTATNIIGTTTATSSVLKKRSYEKVSSSKDTEPVQDLPVELRMMLANTAANDTTTSNNKSATSITTNDNNDPPAKVARRGRGMAVRGRGRGRGKAGDNSQSLDNNSTSNTVDDSYYNDFSSSHENGILHNFGNSNSGGADNDFGPREDVLWTIGWEQLDREERHDCCISLAYQLMENIAGQIVTVMLDLSMPTEMGDTQLQSCPVRLIVIYEKLKSKLASSNSNSSGTNHNTNNTIDMTTVKKLMELMRCDAVGMVAKVPQSDEISGGPSYMINITTIINYLKKRVLHSIASEKFGIESGRIVELLLQRKYLDQSKISDLAILPAREARERVYQLYQHKWIDYFELNKRLDFQPSTSIFLWYVDQKKLEYNLLENMYLTIYNLRCRRLHEYTEGKQLVDFAHQITDIKEAEKFDSLSRAFDRMDVSILKLYDTIILIDKL